MELITLGIEESLVILKSNQKITLTAYKSKIDHSIDLGIDAPRSVTIDHEEIRVLKKIKHQKNTCRETSCLIKPNLHTD